MTADTFSSKGQKKIIIGDAQTNILIDVTQAKPCVFAGTSPLNVFVLYTHVYIFKLL